MRRSVPISRPSTRPSAGIRADRGRLHNADSGSREHCVSANLRDLTRSASSGGCGDSSGTGGTTQPARANLVEELDDRLNRVEPSSISRDRHLVGCGRVHSREELVQLAPTVGLLQPFHDNRLPATGQRQRVVCHTCVPYMARSSVLDRAFVASSFPTIPPRDSARPEAPLGGWRLGVHSWNVWGRC